MLVTHDRQLAARCDRTLTLVKAFAGAARAPAPTLFPRLLRPLCCKEYPLPPEQRPALWWLFAGITLFATMDAAAKWVGRTYPLTAAVWLRYLDSNAHGGRLSVCHARLEIRAHAIPRVQILRGLSLVTNTLCFWTALHHLPLVEAATVSFVGPTIVVIFPSFPAWRTTAAGALGGALGVLPVC